MEILGVIPARYASSRFPGKPLAMIDGKTMIRRVYEQALKSRSLSRVVVATDDERIARHVREFGGEVMVTSDKHPSGTDRCAEVAQRMGLVGAGSHNTASFPLGNHPAPTSLPSGEGRGGAANEGEPRTNTPAYIINIQGDEPFIDPTQIDALVEVLRDGSTEIATLIIPVDDHDVLFDVGEVKVVLNPAMEALYFSRAVIPFLKDVPEREWHLHRRYYRHVGMYAYRADVLARLTKLPISSLEKAESLEQLRWLEAGYKVKCALTHHDSHCIDKPEDIEKVLKLMAAQKK